MLVHRFLAFLCLPCEIRVSGSLFRLIVDAGTELVVDLADIVAYMPRNVIVTWGIACLFDCT